MALSRKVRNAAKRVATCRHPDAAYVVAIERRANDPSYSRQYGICLDCGSTRWENTALSKKALRWRRPGLVASLLDTLRDEAMS